MSDAVARAIAISPPWLQYICEVCGLIYDEAQGDPDSGLPPGTRFADIPEDWACPICGVGKADFAPYTPPSAVALAGRPRRSSVPRNTARGGAGVLIVGAGRAGWQVAQALRERDAGLPITLLSACNGDVYDKPQLSVAIARGLAVDGLVREPARAAAQRLNVRLLADTHAVHIDTARQRLRTTRGTLRWQHLVLAHGAAPALPAALPAALVWRVNDLAAYTRLRAALGSAPQRIALIGAGLVGCELANDLALAGHHISLIDLQPRPLAALLPEAASARLLAAWQDLPIRFIGGHGVAGVEPLRSDQPDGRLRVRLVGGECLDVDHVIAATGLRTPGRLAASAGLHYDSAAGGIAVDAATCACSHPGIYALGDCAVVGGAASRFIEPIDRQARAIAAAITGAAAEASAAAGAATGISSVLRVKTSALPITVTGRLSSDGHWQTERDDAQVLQMRHLSCAGELLATLSAGAVVDQRSTR